MEKRFRRNIYAQQTVQLGNKIKLHLHVRLLGEETAIALLAGHSLARIFVIRGEAS